MEGPNQLYEKSRDRVQKYFCDKDCKKETVIESFDDMYRKSRFITLFLIPIILSIIIQLFLGKFLWNNVVSKLFSGTKKMNSVYQFLGLIIFFQLLGLSSC